MLCRIPSAIRYSTPRASAAPQQPSWQTESSRGKPLTTGQGTRMPRSPWRSKQHAGRRTNFASTMTRPLKARTNARSFSKTLSQSHAPPINSSALVSPGNYRTSPHDAEQTTHPRHTKVTHKRNPLPKVQVFSVTLQPSPQTLTHPLLAHDTKPTPKAVK